MAWQTPCPALLDHSGFEAIFVPPTTRSRIATRSDSGMSIPATSRTALASSSTRPGEIASQISERTADARRRREVICTPSAVPPRGWSGRPLGGRSALRGKREHADQIILKLPEAELEVSRGTTVPEASKKIGVMGQTHSLGRSLVAGFTAKRVQE